jgi:hypothetical protein
MRPARSFLSAWRERPDLLHDRGRGLALRDGGDQVIELTALAAQLGLKAFREVGLLLAVLGEEAHRLFDREVAMAAGVRTRSRMRSSTTWSHSSMFARRSFSQTVRPLFAW